MPKDTHPAAWARAAATLDVQKRAHVSVKVAEDIPLYSFDALPFAGAARAKIASSVLRVFSSTGKPSLDYLHPEGDPGLFGPDAVCWRVHADLASMMVGGISALLLQMLHPLALAGVVDHSNFRHDLLGRLRRTAFFIAGTTYGSRKDAERLIARVREVHSTVVGTAPDGRPYAANDPSLLTWVHVAEVSSFLRSYRRYVDDALSPAEEDRYYDETALVAERLGARDVPRTSSAVEAYFAGVRPTLAVSERTREVASILLDATAPHAFTQALTSILMTAAIDLLPPWAQRLSGFEGRVRRGGPAARTAVRAIGPVLRWALRDNAAETARRRVGAGK
jgi:uncharacterized protein (DUF2236 family)